MDWGDRSGDRSVQRDRSFNCAKAAQMGMRVALTARREGRLANSLLRSVPVADRPRLPTDLRQPEMILNFSIRLSNDKVPCVSWLIMPDSDTHLLDGGTEEWREMLEVNVLALCAYSGSHPSHATGWRLGTSHTCFVVSAHRVPRRWRILGKQVCRAPHRGLRLELHEAGSRIACARSTPALFGLNSPLSTTRVKPPPTLCSRYEVLEPDDVTKCSPVHPGATSLVQLYDLLSETNRARELKQGDCSRMVTTPQASRIHLCYRTDPRAHFPKLSMESSMRLYVHLVTRTACLLTVW